MELNAFIQSGLLESYVLGQCTSSERALVKRMLAQHPEVRVEMDKIEQALENVAQAYAIAPPAGLKERILSEIERPTGPTSSSPGGTSDAPFRPLPWIAGALCLAAAFLFYQNNTLREQNKAQAQTLTTQTQELADCNARTGLKERIYALQRAPKTQFLPMQDGKTTVPVYYNPERCEIAFNFSNLPDRSSENKYYQLWAIVEGKPNDPQSMGMVHAKNIDRWMTSACVPGATTYALSLETGPDEKAKPIGVAMAVEVKGSKGG